MAICVETFENAYGETFLIAKDNPERDFQKAELAGRVERALGILTSKQAEVLKLVFGLNGRDRLSYAEIAEIVGSTVAGVSNLRKSALDNLKYKSDSLQQIVDYDFWKDREGINPESVYQ